MTNKVNRKQVIQLLIERRGHQTIGAIKKQKDLPYFESVIIWHNEHPSLDSLRISKSGLYELKECFKLYPIPLKPGFQVKNVHIKYLEQDLYFPYYLDTKKLVLFGAKDAMEIKLHDGDLDAWARSRWINDRYQEPPNLPDEEY